jgi:hypothetical protein
MAAEPVSAPLTSRRRGRPYDAGARRRGVQRAGESGFWCYIPGDVLRDAGFAPDEPRPWYRLVGHRRSRNAGTVLVSLYREP